LKEFSYGDEAPAIELNEIDPELQRIEAEKISELIDGSTPAKPSRTLDQFMQDIALLTDADVKEDETDMDRVSLMTIHAAKGLEFPYVFIVGVEENLFPSPLSLNSRSDLEEERRLFYVALTRAEKRATITYSASRYKWGSLTTAEPSRFIEEIDPKLIDYANAAARGEFNEFSEPSFGLKKPTQQKTKPETYTPPAKKNLVRAKTANAAPVNIDNSHLKDLAVGNTVKHERFGTGKVTALEGTYPNTKATVEFDDAGQKQLLLKFAKLQILG
jgi:DNA helicase-2/ATP-dependent DNA helicase PcrA